MGFTITGVPSSLIGDCAVHHLGSSVVVRAVDAELKNKTGGLMQRLHLYRCA